MNTNYNLSINVSEEIWFVIPKSRVDASMKLLLCASSNKIARTTLEQVLTKEFFVNHFEVL